MHHNFDDIGGWYTPMDMSRYIHVLKLHTEKEQHTHTHTHTHGEKGHTLGHGPKSYNQFILNSFVTLTEQCCRPLLLI